MGRKKIALVRARVLVGNAAYGLVVGQVVEADPVTIAGLEAIGDVDPHQDAVAYALSQGGDVVTIDPVAFPDEVLNPPVEGSAATAELKAYAASDVDGQRPLADGGGASADGAQGSETAEGAASAA